MEETTAPPAPGGASPSGVDVHPIQKLMDNPWLLLVLGVVVPVLSYTVWGLIELLSVAPE